MSAVTDTAVPKCVMSTGQYLFSWKGGIYTKSLTCPHKKKSHGVRSRDHGSHFIKGESVCPAQAIQQFSVHVWLCENWEMSHLTGRNSHSSSTKTRYKKKVKGCFMGLFNTVAVRSIVFLPPTSSRIHLQRRHASYRCARPLPAKAGTITNEFC